MVELMEGYFEPGDNIGLTYPDLWSPDAVDFLSATTSASSANELLEVSSVLSLARRMEIDRQQHRFLRSFRPERLKGLVDLVSTGTKPAYKYLDSYRAISS